MCRAWTQNVQKLLALIGFLAFSAAPAIADDRTVPTDQDLAPKSAGRNLWKWSLVTYATASVVDAISSVGPHYGHETNSFLADSNGNFRTGKAVAFKSGVFAGTGIAEYLIIRKWPQSTKFFSIVNFGWSAAELGVASHNFKLRK
jgi:hypothetical protein